MCLFFVSKILENFSEFSDKKIVTEIFSIQILRHKKIKKMEKKNSILGKASYASSKLMGIIKMKKLYNEEKVAEYIVILRELLSERGFRDGTYLMDIIEDLLPYLENEQEQLLSAITKVVDAVDNIKSAEKQMRLLECKSTLRFNKQHTTKQETDNSVELRVGNIVFIPTMGGNHKAIVYQLIPENKALCYPFTTAKREKLIKLGLQSVEIKHCSISSLNGTRITSSFCIIDANQAKSSIQGFLPKNREIENAIRSFNYSKMIERC